jgi:hypothetical protein
MNPGEVFFIRLFALLGICAAPLDIVFILTIGALRPKYNGITSFASLLGVPGTPYAMLISGWWFLYGFMLILFAVGLLFSMPRDSRVRWIGPLLIMIFGIFDGIGSAVFPCDPGCAGLTIAGKMHVLVSAVGTAALVPAPFFCWLGWRQDRRFEKILTFSWIVQIAGLLLLVILLFARLKGVADYLNGFGGLIQRLVYTVYYLWLVPVGVTMYRLAGAEMSGG